MIENITVIVPSYNTLNHLQNTYASIRKFYPNVKLIIVDDASTDGTSEWLHILQDSNLTTVVSSERKGHTYWYDEGMRMSETDICAILHSDMMIGPLYFENQLKHLKPQTVVCATRVEPPIHPEGLEKIVKNFGMDYFDFDADSFYSFCMTIQESDRDKKTKGIFAPWLLFKDDHLRIGGHDQNFAPYGYEDSDIFNRWILAGYNMVQSRDALVYHLTCRGHRWNKGVGIENADYKETMERGRKYFLRKWGQWIQNDEHMFPIIYPKYQTRLVIHNLHDYNLLNYIEPLFSNVLCDNKQMRDTYVENEQKSTKLELSTRIITFIEEPNLAEYDVTVIVDNNTFTVTDAQTIYQLSAILFEMENIPNVSGMYELGNIKVYINKLENITQSLVMYNG
jgi:glycosyltransferase involved in cell wall biosynthesis